MRKKRIHSSILLLLLFVGWISCKYANQSHDYLLVFTDTVNNKSGYKNQKGNIIIQPGKYAICFTDTFRTYAIVLKPEAGFVAIDRQENVLYQIFPFDNAPDYPSEGLFRIVKDNKIGFADASTGQIIIQPQFDCAFSFENGMAKVSTECKSESDGEHTSWVSSNWYYIDKAGKKAEQPGTAN